MSANTRMAGAVSGESAPDATLRTGMTMLASMINALVPGYVAATPAAQARFRARLAGIVAEFEADAAGEAHRPNATHS